MAKGEALDLSTLSFDEYAELLTDVEKVMKDSTEELGH